jgi:hypothetical protein
MLGHDLAAAAAEYFLRLAEDLAANHSEDGDSQLTRLALREERSAIGELRPIGENAPLGRRSDGSQRTHAADEPRRMDRARESRKASGRAAS